jgi:hypothetical protein
VTRFPGEPNHAGSGDWFRKPGRGCPLPVFAVVIFDLVEVVEL